MRTKKELKERVRLLEYENEIFSKRLKWIEIKLGTQHPPILHGRSIKCEFLNKNEDGWDLSYHTLRQKYREFTPKYKEDVEHVV